MKQMDNITEVGPGVVRINIPEMDACITVIGPACGNPTEAFNAALEHVQEHEGPHMIGLDGFNPYTALVWTSESNVLAPAPSMRLAVDTAMAVN